ncbi:3-methyl-2-oxobutanoate hydroxymethyltransferase [Mesorhizobium sp. M1004]
MPSRATWTGGLKAVGRTAEAAVQAFEAGKQLEAAGAIGAEIEIVRMEVGKAISERTPLIMMSVGAGTGCDAQYCSPSTSSARIGTHAAPLEKSIAARRGYWSRVF